MVLVGGMVLGRVPEFTDVTPHASQNPPDERILVMGVDCGEQFMWEQDALADLDRDRWGHFEKNSDGGESCLNVVLGKFLDQVPVGVVRVSTPRAQPRELFYVWIHQAISRSTGSDFLDERRRQFPPSPLGHQKIGQMARRGCRRRSRQLEGREALSIATPSVGGCRALASRSHRAMQCEAPSSSLEPARQFHRHYASKQGTSDVVYVYFRCSFT